MTVESLPEAINLMLVSGSERARWMVHGEPLYYGPDRELLLLEECALALLSKVRLVVYDFDGVMTDNRVFVDEHGTESVAANRSDGLGIGMIRKLGLVQCILSTEVNPVVQARAAKLGIPAVNGVWDKGSALKELAAEHGVSLDEILFVGNDVNDSEPMKLAGVSVSPADGHPDVRNMADFVTKATGGHGVIRELTDMLISAGSGSEPGQA